MKDLICEGNGDLSSIRVNMWIGVAMSILLTTATAIYCFITQKFDSIGPMCILIGIWQAPGVFKTIQKFGEQKVVS